MNYYPYRFPHQYRMPPMHICPHMYQHHHWHQSNQLHHRPLNWQHQHHHRNQAIRDQGGEPFVFNINELTKQNKTFRTAAWTGKFLQVTLMTLQVGEDIGLEMHPDVDQFLRIEQGEGLVQMGSAKQHLTLEKYVYDDSAIIVPAGTWHNLTNIGHTSLKLYSIYAPVEHPFGTLHQTKAEAIAAEMDHHASFST